MEKVKTRDSSIEVSEDACCNAISKRWGKSEFRKNFSIRLEKWLQQFDEQEKPLMLKLLKHFYYYTEERLNNKIRKLYARFQKEYPSDSSIAIFTGVEKEVGVGFSSFVFSTFWIKNNLKDSSVNKFTEEVKTWDSIPEVLAIVDDYSGSATTIINYLNKIIKINEDLRKTRYYFLTIHMSKDAVKNIEEFAKHQNLYLKCVYLHQSDRAFKEDYIYKAIDAETNKTKYKEICDRLVISSEYVFGYKQIAALVSFEYNTPNDTLGVFWSDVDGFMALFGRHKSRRTNLTDLRRKAKQNKNFVGKKIIVQNVEETKLNMFMLYCVVWGKDFSVARACYDFGLSSKQFSDIITELIDAKYLEYDDGKLVASEKMKKYIFTSRMSDFKSIFYSLQESNILPLKDEQFDTYIPKKFSKRG